MKAKFRNVKCYMCNHHWVSQADKPRCSKCGSYRVNELENTDLIENKQLKNLEMRTDQIEKVLNDILQFCEEQKSAKLGDRNGVRY